MWRVIFIVGLLATSGFAKSPAPSLFADRIARDIGDVLTVRIIENTTASAIAGTNTKSEYKAGLEGGGTGALDFVPLFGGDASAKSEHKGDGRTTRQGRLTGTVTAAVVEVFPNGNLRIEGQKSLVINGERQLTILSGVIRPEDIAPDNSIFSNMIANAEITFKGKGVLGNTERPGFFARIFDWLF
ncbi:MAG: flagellar basal body L-ring protein FlgH [bacterium]|nr:flagellar basal body L-ring protein FlgH [bacterium]